ncbi:hypothetical protein [Intestinibacter bartlettii]|uniref:Uncharacterized protein n=1 Tax=Intestinibacter bartlettii TaxID=261299 RepID=A0ABS6DTV8_9FIRM|nr:hypothetical protein [Intestinibacter bartlettii]MBU5335275.1 hypothetical protein [Intestinibacter bartlettii]
MILISILFAYLGTKIWFLFILLIKVKKLNKISKKVLTIIKIGDKVLLVFEKQDKTQEAEKQKAKNFLKKLLTKKNSFDTIKKLI